MINGLGNKFFATTHLNGFIKKYLPTILKIRLAKLKHMSYACTEEERKIYAMFQFASFATDFFTNAFPRMCCCDIETTCRKPPSTCGYETGQMMQLTCASSSRINLRTADNQRRYFRCSPKDVNKMWTPGCESAQKDLRWI